MSSKVAAAAIVFLWALPSYAFVCQRVGSDSGPSLWWATRELSYTLFVTGTGDIAGNVEDDIIDASFATWEGVSECVAPGRTTDLLFTRAAEKSSTLRVGYNFADPNDNENLIVFRDDGWALPGQEGVVIALTTTTFAPLTGELVDADIEFNSADFIFSEDAENYPKQCTVPPVDCDCFASSTQAPANCVVVPVVDLMSAAVHEIGHYLGLAHTNVFGATMQAHGGGRNNDMRTLECDDKNGIVFKYPAGEPPGFCQPTVACGFCAPPGVLTTAPDVQVTGKDDGLGGCNCRTSSPTGAGIVLAALLLAQRMRARRLAESRQTNGRAR